MAKAKTAAAPKAKKKAAKAAKAVAGTASTKVKRKAAKIKAKAEKGVDALWKLAEHPMVAELLAIGATAAVAAIAEAGIDKGKKQVASKSVKQAGKAAAAAIGARLISEFAGEPKAAKKKAAKLVKAVKPAKA
jgi:hypothetical protein